MRLSELLSDEMKAKLNKTYDNSVVEAEDAEADEGGFLAALKRAAREKNKEVEKTLKYW